MVKSYLRYEQSSSFGLIASGSPNVLWTLEDRNGSQTTRPKGAGNAIAGAAEEVLSWNLKTGELLGRWRDVKNQAEVTVVTQNSADASLFGVGYSDGTIRIWDAKTSTVLVTFNGHRSAITQLVFDDDGVQLASGSRDTDIILWDLVSETGLFKLRGHKDAITGLAFLPNLSTEKEQNGDAEASRFLISSCKDALIKVWDVAAQHCIETRVAQSNGECWAMSLSPDGSALLTAGNDSEIVVWGVDLRRIQSAASAVNGDANFEMLKRRGAFYRQGKDRAQGITFHASRPYFFVYGLDKAVEIWRLRSEGEVKRSLARKRKRRREKLAADGNPGTEVVAEAETNQVDDIANADITEIIVSHTIIRTAGKVKSACWADSHSKKALDVLVSESNNQLELWTVPLQPGESKDSVPADYSRAFSVDAPGHRTDIRALSLSSDERMLASASNGTLKVWNVRTQSCIRTLECGYALCAAFLPGDKIVVVGNRNGDIQVFDISTSSLIDTIKAHDGAIWALQVHPDGRSMASCSADKSTKFFNFEIRQEEIPGTRRTTPKFALVHSRTLKVSDDVLSLRFSPDGRLIALALLDNTVKVFFVDSLRLFLNLYGHKLPVLSMDISFDSKMIVTCSADKNIRLWGLDFGDCHKAIFAHQDSILQVAFVPINDDGNGHNFFSASKDRTVKYWDGAKFERIQTLNGHQGEVWAMAIGRTGATLVTAAHDKTIRVWQQTDEQIFLEEEREKELEDMYESTLVNSLEQDEGDDAGQTESALTTKQTSETLMSGEKIMEALELGMEDLHLQHEYEESKKTQPKAAPPLRNPVYLAHNNISAETYLLNVIQKIMPASLQDALLVLSFDQVCSLFTFLQIFAERQWNTPLTCRILFFLLKVHHRQIIASKQMRLLLNSIRICLRESLKSQKDQIGFNLAALRYVSRQIAEAGQSNFVVDDEVVDGLSKGSKKRGFIDLA